MAQQKTGILYDVDYDCPHPYTVKDFYTNSDELEKYLPKPKKNLIDIELDTLIKAIPGGLWVQFKIIEWDYNHPDATGCPELLWTGNMAEYVYRD